MVDGLDELKLKSHALAGIYAQSGQEELVRYAERILDCSPELHLKTVPELTRGNILAFSVDHVRWCRVRLCPCCCWAKSGKLRAKLFKVIPRVTNSYPGYKFLLVTLTCLNCHQDNSRETINLLNHGWYRLSHRRTFPAVGYFRSLEVTMPYDIYYKGKFVKRMGEKTYKQWLEDSENLDFDQIDKRPTDECNWHLHCLLIVPPTYFSRDNYWSHETWVKNWQKSAKLSYRPMVEIHQVKRNKNQSLSDAILEVSKYTSKPDDLIQSSDWTIALTDQISGVKSFTVGGILRNFIRQSDLDRLEDTGRFGDEFKQDGKPICFTWNDDKSIYDITSIGDKYYSFSN